MIIMRLGTKFQGAVLPARKMNIFTIKKSYRRNHSNTIMGRGSMIPLSQGGIRLTLWPKRAEGLVSCVRIKQVTTHNAQHLTAKAEKEVIHTLQRMVSLTKQILINTHIIKMVREALVLPNKYAIKKSIQSLAFLSDIIKPERGIVIFGDLEIEPFVKFSTAFQAEYWYLKYQLTKAGKVKLDDNYDTLFSEKEINIIWFNITDEKYFLLECKDGDWFVNFLNLTNEFYILFIQKRLPLVLLQS